SICRRRRRGSRGGGAGGGESWTSRRWWDRQGIKIRPSAKIQSRGPGGACSVATLLEADFTGVIPNAFPADHSKAIRDRLKQILDLFKVNPLLWPSAVNSVWNWSEVG